MRLHFSVALLSVAGSAIALTAAETAAQHPATCGGAPTSRWSTSGGAYRATATFGDTGKNYIASLHGLATNKRGDVFVHDGEAARVFGLSAMLQLRRTFGRAGEGPGELSVRLLQEGPFGRANTLAATDSVLYLADRSRVLMYGMDGGYIDDYIGPPAMSPLSFDVRGLYPAPRGLLLGHRSPASESARSAVRTLLLGGPEPKVQHSLFLSPPSNGRPNLAGPRHPRPLWAAYNSCLFVGDGASPWLLRVNLETGKTDTLRLLRHDVPPFRSDPRAERLETILRRQGVTASLDVEPPELWRYTQIEVDPDGHVWVNLWWERGEAPAPLPVLRIDPGGAVHQERLKAFPLAFGAAGVYYAREVNPDTDEIRVVRYERIR